MNHLKAAWQTLRSLPEFFRLHLAQVRDPQAFSRKLWNHQVDMKKTGKAIQKARRRAGA